MPTDKSLYELSTAGLSHKKIAEQFNLNKDSVRGRISRYARTLQLSYAQLQERVVMLEAALEEKERESEPMHALGTPWRLSGDFIVAGDVHCDTVNKGFMQRPLQIAKEYLEYPRKLLVVGDFINANHWSRHEAVSPQSSFARELASARAFFDLYLKTFDIIKITLGNHDRWVQRGSRVAIEPQDLLRMISNDPRIEISWWGHAIIETPNGEFRCTHGSEYSVNQLVVADQMAQKYQQHIIHHHQHHLARGMDRFKKYIIIDNGGLFDETAMAYAVLDDNKKARMMNGFTLLKNGTPYLFGREPYTDYDFWLRGKAA